MNDFTLLCGDCLDLMRDIPNGSIDMILCDLPYGTTKNKWDSIIPLDHLWSHYKRIVKANGAIVLFCDGMFTKALLQSNEKMWRYNMVWDKRRGCDFLNANVKPLKSHEDIAVFYRKNRHTTNNTGILLRMQEQKTERFLTTMELERKRGQKVQTEKEIR